MLELHRAFARLDVPAVSATHGGSFQRVYDDADVDLLRLGEISAERQREMVASVPGMRGPKSDMWTAAELRSQVEAELRLIERLAPRVLVTGWTLSALISSKVAGIPLVTEHAGLWLPPLWENNRAPLPSKKPSPVLHLLPEALAVRGFNQRVPRIRAYLGAVNQVCREYGVEELPSFAAMVMGDLTLVMDVPEVFGFSRAEIEAWRPQLPEAYRVGARLAYGGPLFAKLAIPVPDRVSAFLERRPIYVAMTSTPPRTVRAVVAALRPLGLPLLVSGGGHDLRDLESPDVMVEDLLPNHLVVPQTRLMVAAGGHGSLQTALAAGVPFLGLPLQPEQDTNIVLAERQGAARRVALKHAGSPRLARAAREMLDDPSYGANAQRLAAVYASVDGAMTTARVVMDFAGIEPARR
jgi:UDP:flavonoid glycosyltransferase YjiC (YdhE family)